MFNKHLRPVDTTLFLNRLNLLLEKLKTQYQDGTLQTQEDVLEEFIRAVQEFYIDLKKPFLKYRPVVAGTSPDLQNYSSSFKELGWDLDIVFKELETLEKLVLSNFNYMVSEKDKLTKLTRRISSKVGDYVLYVEDPIGKAIYFKDSFNDSSKVDFGSTLLTEKQCEINHNEGIVTLPVAGDGTPTRKEFSVKLNSSSSSTGSVGNYQELNVAPHDDIRDILDGNPDTWFEFERVANSIDEFEDNLRLDITLYTESPQIVNFIRVNPNNFGTQTPVLIVSIDTSLDGDVWTSIKDDIPIADFLQEDEENVFTLASSTSKYAGQGLYTFTPRKVKYVRIVFEQKTSYEIQTSGGTKWRQAIGIRDIELHGIQYDEKGDFISLPFTSPVEIQKISILASENPAEFSELADIVHQVSVDDGATWHVIQPQDRSTQNIPEIININTEDTGSLISAEPVFSLRHRMLLARYPDKFQEGATTLSKVIKNAIDITALPQQSPVAVQLTRTPIVGTVKILNPTFGSRAWMGIFKGRIGNPTVEPGMYNTAICPIGRFNGHSGAWVTLPVSKELESGLITKDNIVIWVDELAGYSSLAGDDDITWTRVSSFTSSTPYDRHYIITDDGRVVFGNGEEDPETTKGYIPKSGSIIGFTLTEESLCFTSSSPYVAELKFQTDGNKDNVDIFVIKDAEDGIYYTRPGASVHRLPNRFVAYEYPNETSAALSFSNDTENIFDETKEVEYIDGEAEFAGATDGTWSFDANRGILHSYSVPTSSTVTIEYVFYPVIDLTPNDWDFVETNNPYMQRIRIKDDKYITRSKTKSFSGSEGKQVISLGTGCVARGTIRFTGTIFQNGDSKRREVKFIDGYTEFKQVIDDSVVDREGWYSIDYENGIMYVSPEDAIVPSAASSSVSFQYTSYAVLYNIARYLDGSKFTVDAPTKSISISPEESIKVWGDKNIDVKRSSTLKIIYDYVHTTRESIEELEKFFSPVVRDVVLKILPKE